MKKMLFCVLFAILFLYACQKSPSFLILQQSANSSSANLSPITFYNGNVGIGMNYSSSLLYVDGNKTSHFSTIDSPWIMVGGYYNHLLQTEVMDHSTVTWKGNYINRSAANILYDPRNALTAEWLQGLNNVSNFSQTVTNTISTNITCSAYIISYNTTSTVCMRINMNESNTSNTNVGIPECFNISGDWERYATTIELRASHVNYSLMFNFYQNNVSIWAAQCEPNTQFPSRYSGALTTGAIATYTTTALIPTALTISGTFSSPTIAGGTLSGSTVTGTGAHYANIATTTANVSYDGFVCAASTAATAPIPVQNSPRLRFAANVWNNTATSMYQYSMLLKTNNLTKEVNFTTFITLNNYNQTNYTISEVVTTNLSNTNYTTVLNTNLTLPKLNSAAGGYLCIAATTGRVYVGTTCP